MSAPRAVIVGSGRSGSGYIAAVLNAAGIRCGHEGWWNPLGEREDGLEVDSSWCALARDLGRYRGTVLYQSRHPLAVISSFLKAPTEEPYLALQRRLVERRLLYVPSNDLEFAAATWVCAHRAALERASWSWRVEDVAGWVVHRIARYLGVDDGERHLPAEKALATVPHDTNWHGPGERLTWVDLPDCPIVDALRDDADEWGYA